MARKKPAAPEPAAVEAIAAPDYTLEDLLTSPLGFRLPASPVQRAVCRVIDGLPLGDLAELPEVVQAMGGPQAIPYLQAPQGKPREVYFMSGSRVGKTLITAAIVYKATQTVQVSHLGHGDEPRCPVISIDKDKANACYLHLVNNVKASALLAPSVAHEGRNELDSPAVWIKHPSGRKIQVCVAANKAAGNAVVAYWLSSVVFDEAPRMAGADAAVVNFADTRKNALSRILPGGQLIAIGSPWAPFGPMYEAVQARWGKPGPDLVVIKARGRYVNPSHWTAELIAKTPADILRTEEEAEFQTPEEALYNEETIKACGRPPGDLPRERGLGYAAMMDPATRSNAWTVVIGAHKENKLIVACVRQWLPQPGAPLSPSAVFAEMAALLKGYGIDTVTTDQYSTDALRELADLKGITLVEQAWTADRKVECYGALATRFAEGTIEVPLDPDLLDDLKLAKKVVTQAGVTIVLPERRTANGLKRHCDYVPSLAGLQDQAPPEGDNEEKEESWEEREIERRQRKLRERRQEEESWG